MDLPTPVLVMISFLLGFVAYLAFVLRSAEDDFARPRPQLKRSAPVGRLQEPGAGGPPPDAATESTSYELQIRPPVGSVASGISSAGSSRASQSGEAETLGLLRVLEGSSDIQRQAAAQALALPFAGSCHPDVVEALARLVRDEGATGTVRAEAWIALRAVMGEELSWDQEVAARQAFPEGLDEAWLDQLLG